MKSFIKATALLTGLIILDQALKTWVIAKGVSKDLGIISINLVTNTGASFGILKGSNTLLAFISMIALGIIMISAEKITRKQTMPVIILTAGIIGNLIDRLFRGFVIDFIDLKFWPVFNIADSLIVIGAAWLGLIIILEDKKKISKDKKKLRRRVKQKRKRTGKKN